MITHPTPTRLLAEVRTTLREVVSPLIGDGDIKVTLEAIDSILNSLATRSECEIDYMLAEIDEIEALAGEMLTVKESADLRYAMLDVELARPTTFKLSAVQHAYNAAGRLLAACVECVFADHAAFKHDLEQLLAKRIGRESEMRGSFRVVGKS